MRLHRRVAACVFALALSAPALAEAAPPAAADLATQLATPALSQLIPVPNSGDFLWVRGDRGHHSIRIGRPGQVRTIIAFREDDGRTISQLGITPDRRFIHFLRAGTGEERSAGQVRAARATLYVVAVETGRIAHEIAANAVSIVATQDGRRILFADGAAIRQIDLANPDRPVAALVDVRGAQRDLVLSPDGRRVAFVSNRSVYGRGGYSFVAVYDLADNRLTYMSPGLGYDQNPVWSPDGRRLAFLRVPMAPKSFRFGDFRTGPSFSIVVADAGTGAGRALFTAPRGAGSVFSPMTSYPDYDRLYRPTNLFWTAAGQIVFPWERTGWRHLYAIDADTPGAPRALTGGAFEISGALLSADRRRLSVTANPGDALRPRAFVVDPGTGEMTALPGRAVQNAVAWCPDAQCLVIEQWDPLVPATYYLSGNEGAGAPVPIEADAVSEHRTAGMVTASSLRFTTRDGLTLDAIVYRPAGEPGVRLPVIVYAHGGSRWQSTPGRSFDAFEALPHAIAARGFVYVAINYRSGVGYGAAFREPGRYGARSEGGGDVDDFVDLVRFLRRQPYVDPHRIGVFGVSYGGYLVGNLLARHSDLFAAGASISGVGDWVREMENDTGRVLNFNVSARTEIEDRAYRSSAISAIQTWRSPLLLIHGDGDTDGHMEADIELWTALTQRGVDVESLIIPNETHTFSRWENRVAVQAAILDFFLRRLGTEQPR